MIIYINTVTRECFNESGDFFKSNMPQIPYLSNEDVKIVLCTSTDGGNDAGAIPENWTRDTSYANINGIGAIITVDNDFIHKIKGSLTTQITSGPVTSIVTEIEGASIAKIPSSGVVRIFNSSGSYETLTYSARNVNGNSVTFTTSGNLVNTYPEGTIIDCDQSPYCSAYLNTSESNIQQGEFVFYLSCSSDRLREEMEYSDVEKLSVKGIELLIYKTEDSNDQILNAFICDTFSIVGTIGTVGFEAEPPDGTENKIAALVDQLLAAGFEVEQQYDSAGNTQFRFRSIEAGGTWSSWVTVNKGDPGTSNTLTIGTVTTGEPGTQASATITGESPNQVLNLTIPRGNAGSGASVGSIALFAGATIPEGYLLCDGAALSREVYSELFSAIGTTWGEGDGSTTFNLPDFSGKFIRGTGGNAAALGTVQAEGLPNAEGWFQLRYGSIVSADNSMFTFIQDTTTTSASYTGQQAATKITMSLSGANPIFGASNHVTPENCSVNLIIKYQG